MTEEAKTAYEEAVRTARLHFVDGASNLLLDSAKLDITSGKLKEKFTKAFKAQHWAEAQLIMSQLERITQLQTQMIDWANFGISVAELPDDLVLRLRCARWAEA